MKNLRDHAIKIKNFKIENEVINKRTTEIK